MSESDALFLSCLATVPRCNELHSAEANVSVTPTRRRHKQPSCKTSPPIQCQLHNRTLIIEQNSVKLRIYSLS